MIDVSAFFLSQASVPPIGGIRKGCLNNFSAPRENSCGNSEQVRNQSAIGSMERSCSCVECPFASNDEWNLPYAAQRIVWTSARRAHDDSLFRGFWLLYCHFLHRLNNRCRQESMRRNPWSLDPGSRIAGIDRLCMSMNSGHSAWDNCTGLA